MHRQFFAIGLALSFAVTGGFLGWQQIQLDRERKAAQIEEELRAEIVEKAENAEADASEYTAEVPVPEFPSADGIDDIQEQESAADTSGERLAALESAIHNAALENEGPSESAGTEIKESANIKKRGEFSTVDRSYFTDALFVGDSRMVGIKEYGGLKEPTYFANTGLSTFALYSKELEVQGIGTITFEDLITNHSFGKVYIMLGINEAGSKLSEYQEKLDLIVADVMEKQPGATVFLMANLHVTKYKSETDKTFSNAHIDEINATIDKIAAKYGAYYIDANPLFDDEEGNLSKDCAADYAHLKGRCYPEWIDFICTKGIVYEKENESAF